MMIGAGAPTWDDQCLEVTSAQVGRFACHAVRFASNL